MKAEMKAEMKAAKLLQYKSVQVALVLIALAGAFVVGRCLISKSPEPSEGTVLEVVPSPGQREEVVGREQSVEKGEVRFDEQCRDVRLVRSDTQYSLSLLYFPEDRWGAKIYGERIYEEPNVQESSPPLIVLLKPVRKKRRIAPLKKKVEEYVPRIFDEDVQYACKGNLIPAVLTTVADLEARSILYGMGPLSDCSGIFHRVLMGVQKRCPDHEYPSVKQYRDSRELARWYHEQGELIVIKNVVVQSGLIRPGMALFFGRTGVKYKNASAKTLFSSQYGIYHVGVVARVYRDKGGKVAGYDLFHGHGRKGKTKASITKWHKRRPTRASYPPFGNGRQQLVAAAWIVPVKKALEVIEQ